jgi:hypothetical protein
VQAREAQAEEVAGCVQDSLAKITGLLLTDSLFDPMEFGCNYYVTNDWTNGSDEMSSCLSFSFLCVRVSCFFCVNAALRRHEVAGDAQWQDVQGTGRKECIMYANDMVLRCIGWIQMTCNTR